MGFLKFLRRRPSRGLPRLTSLGQVMAEHASRQCFRDSFPEWIRSIGEYAPDPIADALFSLCKWEERDLYTSAIQEIRDAYMRYRIPASWAQKVVLAYREQFAAAARAKAAAVRDVTRREVARHSS